MILIDFENVQPELLTDLAKEHFRVVIFVGANQTKIPTALAMSLQRLGERVEYVQISGNGPNALDFHIAFYIGQYAAQDPMTFFHIISKDSGFDPLIHHLKSRKIYAVRSPSIDSIPALKNVSAKTPGERAKAYVEKLQQPKSSKPKTTKTLSSSIKAYFQNLLSDADAEKVIAIMQSEGHITVKDGKVAYAI